MQYKSVSEYYKQLFGCKIYKLAIDAGCTCPTRDGMAGTKGCIFCSTNGSGDFTPDRNLSITEQIQKAKLLVQKKAYGRTNSTNPKYIAYFQNFTNTYGDPAVLEKKYIEAAKAPDIVGIDIATRPDCLSEDILQRIARISEETFVTIELGLQTANNTTSEYIRRSYKTQVYDQAVTRIKKSAPKVHIVTQLIFGLPGETEEDMLDSVKHAVTCGTDGFKFTVLYVLKGTDLSEDFKKGKFECLTMEKYFEILKKALKIIPEQTVIHRLTGDGPKNLLLAPEWTKNKRFVMNSLKNYLSNEEK